MKARGFVVKFAKGAKGFSLIELLVVVGIIGVLAAVGAPKYSRYTARSRNTASIAFASAVSTAEEARNVSAGAYINPNSTNNLNTLFGGNGTAALPQTIVANMLSGDAANGGWNFGMLVPSGTFGDCQNANVGINVGSAAGVSSNLNSAVCQ